MLPSFAIARPNGRANRPQVPVGLLDEKASHKGLDRLRLAVLEADAHDLVAAWRLAIARTVHRRKRVAAVFLRKVAAIGKNQLHRGGMGRVAQYRPDAGPVPIIQRTGLGLA